MVDTAVVHEHHKKHNTSVCISLETQGSGYSVRSSCILGWHAVLLCVLIDLFRGHSLRSNISSQPVTIHLQAQSDLRQPLLHTWQRRLHECRSLGKQCHYWSSPALHLTGVHTGRIVSMRIFHLMHASTGQASVVTRLASDCMGSSTKQASLHGWQACAKLWACGR